ncbi:MAG: PSD1 and planctomycete cytochrome C domain-containing protein [Aeoliella sp.]
MNLLYSMVRQLALTLLAAALTLSGGRCVCGGEPTFNRDIRPLLSDRCFVCHGPDAGAREADLRLDLVEHATASVIVPGSALQSEMYARITADDPDLRMPPVESNKEPLSAQEAELIRGWIDGGAQYERHWAYLTPTRPAVPEVALATWPRNEIDRFLLREQEAAGVGPAPEAPKATLVRRLYLDLIGLPPTPAEVDAFLLDSRDDAYQRLVDQLLASPHFGERKASWWFDLVRFASTVGYHGDQEHSVTPYRDYVIKSFNDNLPFNQFTMEQLAGDLLENPTMWQRVATGYTRLNQTTSEGGVQDGEYRAKYLADRVRNVSEVWLAASMGCAECHEHKFDPYPQRAFYEMAAFFADVDRHGDYNPVIDFENPTQRPPEMLAWTLPVYERLEAIRPRIDQLRQTLAGDLPTGYRKLQEELQGLMVEQANLESAFEPQMIAQAIEPATVRVFPRGNWRDESGEIVQPATPDCLPPLDVDDRRATRLDLARWLTRDDHPLTARVFVNRLWKLYFGQGFTEVLIDAGSQSDWPTHPELLDWLAVEFIESGWDVKHVVRLMVTSSAYRQASLERPELEEGDPHNRLLTRQRRWRLDAEQIRDTALGVSGLLNRQVGGGVSRPYQPAGYYATLNFPERKYQASDGPNQYRRAVYAHWQRQYVHPWLLAFDAPTREECTAQRLISNTPSAALVLLNDPSFVEAARALAERCIRLDEGDEAGAGDVGNGDAGDSKGDRGRIAWIWREVLLREPRGSEVSSLHALLLSGRAKFQANPPAAQALAAVGHSAPAEDVDLVELAAWTNVCRVLLNLNEMITRN